MGDHLLTVQEITVISKARGWELGDVESAAELGCDDHCPVALTS